jgi:hypothetical protein
MTRYRYERIVGRATRFVEVDADADGASCRWGKADRVEHAARLSAPEAGALVGRLEASGYLSIATEDSLGLLPGSIREYRAIAGKIGRMVASKSKDDLEHGLSLCAGFGYRGLVASVMGWVELTPDGLLRPRKGFKPRSPRLPRYRANAALYGAVACGIVPADARALRLEWPRLTYFDEENLLSDLSPLQALAQLESLTLRTLDAKANLEALAPLPRLRALDVHWPRPRSLEPLAQLTGLRTLRLCGAAMTDLSPLAALKKLERLELTDLPNAASLEPLRGMSGLRHLRLAGCPDVADLSPLSGANGLESLHLKDCRSIESLAVLGGKPVLEDPALRAGLARMLETLRANRPHQAATLIASLPDPHVLDGLARPVARTAEEAVVATFWERLERA